MNQPQQSRIPPFLLLLIIIGLSGVIAYAVSDRILHSAMEYTAQNSSSRDDSIPHTKSDDPKNARVAVFSRSYIPGSTKIEDKHIEELQIDKLEIWDDAMSTSSDVVGHVTKHAIPEGEQIRQIDLE